MFTLQGESIHNAYDKIHLEEENGNTPIINEPDISIVLNMQERVAKEHRATAYQEAIAGEWELNVLAQVFFSAKNIEIIQNGIRAGVYQMSNNKFVISVPNPDTVKIIMRSIYMQHAEHNPNDITGQVVKLNNYVLAYAVPSTYNEAVGYLQYKEQKSKLAVPLEYQKSCRDYKQLELPPRFI